MEEQTKNEQKPSRRDVVKAISVAIGGTAVGVGGAALVGHLGPAPAGKWRFFDDAQARLVEAVSEQIIPADRDPGAKEAGVVNYIDRVLAGPHQRYQEKYRHGLASLQKTSLTQFSKEFEQLAWGDQTKLLQSMESGKVSKELWTGPSASEFFNLLRDHTMQGFYGSPRHGGNRNYVSFKMLGIEYPRVMGQNRYGKLT